MRRKLVLASASPRRKEILEQMGLTFEICPASGEEKLESEDPEEAVKNGIEGIVYVQFVVDKDGKIVEPKVVQGVCPELDAEALRVVSGMPAWKPGMQRGKPVAVSFVLPVVFHLVSK